jgi:hypothetical protein
VVGSLRRVAVKPGMGSRWKKGSDYGPNMAVEGWTPTSGPRESGYPDILTNMDFSFWLYKIAR